MEHPLIPLDADATEHVVLVDESGAPVGRAPKSVVHTADTPLHRAFSLFLFDPDGRLLLQQRSADKVTWPLVWSNSCCGHPAWGETEEAAARRRLESELSVTEAAIEVALPGYRYRAERDGVVENEVCPVLIGVTRQAPRPEPSEVAATEWKDWNLFLNEIHDGDSDLSPWCQEEALLLAALPDLKNRLRRLTGRLQASGESEETGSLSSASMVGEP